MRIAVEVPISGGDTAAAEAQARAAAARQAVSQVALTFTSPAAAANAPAVEDVAGRPELARETRITTADPSPTVLKARVDVVVRLVPLIAALHEKGLLPARRVAVQITEPQPEGAAGGGTAQVAITRQLLAAGYQVQVSPPQALAAGVDPKRLPTADVVIIGTASSEPAPTPMAVAGFSSARARVEAQAVAVETGRVIAAEAASGAGADLDPASAAKKSIEATADRVALTLVVKLASDAAKP
ncbi:MAG: hypothetical protein HY321_03440 [Armatimonadetes bacterium]|nr:hypothetical protein [Armatimonadota bacterium]